MKLAISNIAWHESEEVEVAEVLKELGVEHLEIAPTKLWEEPTEISDDEIRGTKDFWLKYGIDIVAFQSMLFKRPDLQIFGDNSQEALDYLSKFIELAGRMGVTAMVFGSPKNRLRGQLHDREVDQKARNFFFELGSAAINSQVSFCVEPNPKEYGCDFVTNAEEGIDLVNSVKSAGFGLHLDMAGMSLAGDDIPVVINSAAPVLKHFHVSAPFLEQVEKRADVNYRIAAKALKDINYDKYISIEMRPGEVGENAARVRKAVLFTQDIFGPAS